MYFMAIFYYRVPAAVNIYRISHRKIFPCETRVWLYSAAMYISSIPSVICTVPSSSTSRAWAP